MPPPVGGQTGATTEPISRFRATDFVGQGFELIVRRVDADMRLEEEQVDAVEAHALDFGVGRQIEHRIQIDGRLSARPFADDARPCGVVKFGVIVGMVVHGIFLESYLPSPVRRERGRG